MRVMVILKTTAEEQRAIEDMAPGEMTQMLNEMGRFNAELVKAGLMLGGEGLNPSDPGTKVVITGGSEGKATVLDGPFAETKELIAGFWLLQVSSVEEAAEWMKRIPTPAGQTTRVEIRRIMEDEDFGDALTPEIKAQEQGLREKIAEQHGE